MKTLLMLSLLTVSSPIFASAKCYKEAKQAAFNAIRADDSMIETIEDFDHQFSNDYSDSFPQNGWNKELWAFSDGYSVINVEVHLVKNVCHVKKINHTPSDED